MNMIIGLIGKHIIAAALIMAYIEVGPGGDKIGVAVNTVKSTVLSVNWSKVASEVVVLVKNNTGHNESKEVKNIEEKS